MKKKESEFTSNPKSIGWLSIQNMILRKLTETETLFLICLFVFLLILLAFIFSTSLDRGYAPSMGDIIILMTLVLTVNKIRLNSMKRIPNYMVIKLLNKNIEKMEKLKLYDNRTLLLFWAISTILTATPFFLNLNHNPTGLLVWLLLFFLYYLTTCKDKKLNI